MKAVLATLLLLLCPVIATAKKANPLTLAEVYREDNPALLQINYTPPDFPKHINVVIGTGFLVGNQGYFVTAVHVLAQYEEGTNRLTALLRQESQTGSSGTGFTIVEKDPEHDVALCKLSLPPSFTPRKKADAIKRMPSFPNWVHMPFASLAVASETPDPGEPVALMGFPFGSLVTPVIQGGNVASKNATLMAAQGFNGHDNFLVSVPGNHGNSGGPVISLRTGEVVGILVQYVPAPIVSPVDGRPITTADGAPISQQSGLMAVVPSKYVLQLLEHNKVLNKPSSAKEGLVFF